MKALLCLCVFLWLYAQANAYAECPTGTTHVQILVNNRVIYEGCQAAAELERAGYVADREGDRGTIVCRTLIPKEQERR